MISGDFELHLTGAESQADELAAYAREQGIKFTHIQLDRGTTPSQPMLTVPGHGTLHEMRSLAGMLRDDLRLAGLRVTRTKIEAAPANEGVPRFDWDDEALRYFEHHIKLLLPAADDAVIDAVNAVIHGHEARLSRNARRTRSDGQDERFATQRCHGVGLTTARARLNALLAALRAAGFAVLEVEQEYVAWDSAIGVDGGWLEDDPAGRRERRDEILRNAPAGGIGYPTTYRPLEVGLTDDIRQRAVFDPALKHFPRAFKAGEPVFGDPADGERWRAARRAAMGHVLGVIAASEWAEHLVLRGSVPLRTWLGDAAREPGDLDFVVVPSTLTPDDPPSKAMLSDLIAAIAADPGPGLLAEQVATERIWTYERVPGRRLVFPFAVPGLPRGPVQLDFVYQEPLPEPPVTTRIQPWGVSMATATPGLSLAWKVLWLMTDIWPQGKDLYDAALLAEYAPVRLGLIRNLLRPELREAADDFAASSVLSLKVDWTNFRDEHPGVEGQGASWLRRLADGLAAG